MRPCARRGLTNGQTKNVSILFGMEKAGLRSIAQHTLKLGHEELCFRDFTAMLPTGKTAKLPSQARARRVLHQAPTLRLGLGWGYD